MNLSADPRAILLPLQARLSTLTAYLHSIGFCQQEVHSYILQHIFQIHPAHPEQAGQLLARSIMGLNSVEAVEKVLAAVDQEATRAQYLEKMEKQEVLGLTSQQKGSQKNAKGIRGKKRGSKKDSVAGGQRQKEAQANVFERKKSIKSNAVKVQTIASDLAFCHNSMQSLQITQKLMQLQMLSRLACMVELEKDLAKGYSPFPVGNPFLTRA